MANPKTDGRMIRKGISESDGFAALSDRAAVLFCMLIPHFNPYGKMNGGPGFIKEIVCPKRANLTYENIPALLEEISTNTNVKWFVHDGRHWLHALHFLTEHQKIETARLGKDQFPDFIDIVDDKSTTTRRLLDDQSETSRRQAAVQPECEPEPEREREREAREREKPVFHPGFEPERINSDTPLPPLLQEEWNRLSEVYPKPRGIIKGRDRAIRLFVKSAERARILRNARHYSCSDDAKSGFVLGLDKFVDGGYRDYDEQPLGHDPPAYDTSMASLLDQERAQFQREQAAGALGPQGKKNSLPRMDTEASHG